MVEDRAGRADRAGRPEQTGRVDEPGPQAHAPFYHEGAPPPFQRLWTPHRMVYIKGESKPADDSAGQCPFCRASGADDADALIVHRGPAAYVLMNLYPYNTGHLLVCPYRHIFDWT